MANTESKYDDSFIGYSAWVKFEQIYVGSEDSCVVADDPKTMLKFAVDSFFPARECRIDTVKIGDLKKDYGCASGEYLLGPKSLARFEKVAKTAGIIYEVKLESEWDVIPEGWGLVQIENYEFDEDGEYLGGW